MIRRIISAVFVASILFFSLSACTPNRNANDKARSIGSTAEVLVVVENEQQWENMIGKCIREHLGKEQYGLNQNEPIFSLAHILKPNLSDMFKKHRNILIVDIESSIEKTKIEAYDDMWAKPQQVIKITAPSAQAFVSSFDEHASAFIQNYNEAERKRILTVFRPTSKNKTTAKVRKVFGINMSIPKDFYVAKTDNDFMWIRKEASEYSQGIIIIADTYQDTAQFSPASINARTKRYLKQHIPGSSENTYMTLDEEFVLPQSTIIQDFPMDFTVETRGVWRVEKDFMGGPFISYTFVGPKSEKIYTLYGYVYHPSKEKRNLLKQVEAIIYSTNFMK